MNFKYMLVFLLLALAMVAEASKIHDISFNHVTTVGDLIGDDNEELLDSEANRRTLWGRRRYIGYNSLRANQVPCGSRGRSYYNCQRRGRANPYRRGCTAITHCARNVN
ncbi:hypothetical protein Lal_00025835 [Lupinus albus]|uniref:Putative rapid ALkalinization Factor n=1 Tax=Lupinus albus TaxID=3870 RepID=A0A6A4Q0I3_LUPAL|nr:putative rapid ALkalinization Factor [Lupinus albus]KAF1861490.1 hypothetical protein Lal_00025835 [Lupinus albus]